MALRGWYLGMRGKQGDHLGVNITGDEQVQQLQEQG